MSRGFAVVAAYLDQGIALPCRKTTGSAGYDIASAIDITIAPGQQAFCPTGLKAYMPDDEVLFIYPRSSLFQRTSLVMTNSVGVIDSDYYGNPDNEGQIMISLWNTGIKPAYIAKGERIAQGVFGKYLLACHDESAKHKRSGGFGSTDK